MTAKGAYIAVDWGTTNRRAWLMAGDGAVLASESDGRGVLAIDPAAYDAEVAGLRSRLGDHPILAAGMIGSTRGWRDIPYVDAPADLAALARGSVNVAPGVTILPGVALRTNGRADVMRGEEVQALGATAAGLAPADALFCQPGTHCKWIAMADGALADFATAMTGELFALVKAHGILAGMLDGPVADGPAFHDGLARGMRARDLTVALFEVRAAVLLGMRPAAEAASLASGILIGADVGAQADLSGRDVHLLASGALADLYAAAIVAAGGRVAALDSHAAFRAGIQAIRELLP